MNRRKKFRIRIGALALAMVGVFVVTSTASAHMPMTLTIRHQMVGCHAWSMSPAGPFKATLSIKVDRDASFVIVNNDMMPHKLVQVSGPKALLSKVNMNHIGARGFISFKRAGTYVFRTKAGDDYKWMHGMATKGPDNVLRLKVTVK